MTIAFYFARFPQTISNVTPAGVCVFVKLLSSALIEVTMRRWLGARTKVRERGEFNFGVDQFCILIDSGAGSRRRLAPETSDLIVSR